MSVVEKMIKQVLRKLVNKQVDAIPESQMEKIREMHSTLPDCPQKGKVAPAWKSKQKTAGPNGANSS